MKQYKKIISVLCVGGILAASVTGCGNAAKTVKTASEEPILLTVWTYYNGDQLETFNSLVEKFNTTTGKEKGNPDPPVLHFPPVSCILLAFLPLQTYNNRRDL